MTPDDAALLTRLGAIARVADPVPDAVRQFGRASFGLRRLDAELAELTSDSDELLVGVRSAGTDVRLLTFEADDVVIEAQVSTTGFKRSVLGQVLEVEAATGVVYLESAYDSCDDVTLDELGSFRFDDLPVGTVRLVVTLDGGKSVATRWFRL